MRAIVLAMTCLIAACSGGGPAGPAAPLPPDAVTRAGVSEAEARTLALAQGRCPDRDADRDALLAAAVRSDDPAQVQALLSARPGDATAATALSAITGLGDPDRRRLSCLLPYLDA
jgi:hypothetical protein